MGLEDVWGPEVGPEVCVELDAGSPDPPVWDFEEPLEFGLSDQSEDLGPDLAARVSDGLDAPG